MLSVAGRRISDEAGLAALRRWAQGVGDSTDEASSVRYTLQLLRHRAPGSSVEVRVPPWGAVQAIEGTTHTRGTPPAVVEMSPQVWLELVTGSHTFENAVAAGLIHASGERSNLSAWFPLVGLP